MPVVVDDPAGTVEEGMEIDLDVTAPSEIAERAESTGISKPIAPANPESTGEEHQEPAVQANARVAETGQTPSPADAGSSEVSFDEIVDDETIFDLAHDMIVAATSVAPADPAVTSQTANPEESIEWTDAETELPTAAAAPPPAPPIPVKTAQAAVAQPSPEATDSSDTCPNEVVILGDGDSTDLVFEVLAEAAAAGESDAAAARALDAPGARSREDEEAEELDLDGAEELTAARNAISRPEPQSKTEGELEAEEIDLSEAVEVMAREGASASGGAARSPRIRKRRRGHKEWWAEFFNDDYLALLPKQTPRDLRRDIEFIERTLAVPMGSLVLDLACGNGRHAVAMAQRGYRVVGVDLSLPMLARAGERAQESAQKINFIHGDMRELGFDKAFDSVYNIGTSFGYFDEQSNQKVLEGVARALKPGGVFLLEVANRDHVLGVLPSLTWFEGNGIVCMEEAEFNFINSRLYVTRQIISGAARRQTKQEYSLRLYSLHELGQMLHAAGFIVSHVAGHINTPGAFFGADSAHLIIRSTRWR